jgi:hypothetical protein
LLGLALVGGAEPLPDLQPAFQAATAGNATPADALASLCNKLQVTQDRSILLLDVVSPKDVMLCVFMSATV